MNNGGKIALRSMKISYAQGAFPFLLFNNGTKEFCYERTCPVLPIYRLSLEAVDGMATM